MNVALCGFYGKFNFGDDLVADCLSKILATNGNKVFVFSDTEGNNVLNGFKTKEYINCDIIVIGGGGIISPNFWLFRNERLTELIKAKKNIFFLNVNLTKDILTNTSFTNKLKRLNAQWYVRDHYSIELLGKINIKASFLPDISTYTSLMPQELDKKDERKLSVFLNSYILNNIASNNTEDFIKAHENIRIIAHYLDWMTTFGWKIYFYPCQTTDEFDDRICSSYTYLLMKKKTCAQWINQSLNWTQMVTVIKSSGLVLSMRFHSTTIALVNNIPTIDIVHHDKNKNLLNDLNVPQLMVDYRGLTEDKLIKASQYAEKLEYKTNVSKIYSQSEALWHNFINEWTHLSKGD